MEKRTLHLTFDGAPNPPGTLNILEVLSRHKVKGTFFMEGHRMKEHADLVRRIRQEGHSVGNHSFSHTEFDRLTLEECLREVEDTDALFLEILGEPVQLFRPPSGILGEEVRKVLEDRGYRISLWSFSIRDWEGPDAAAVANRVLAGAHPDGIMVMHDRVEWNPEALDIVIPELKNQGYTFTAL